MRLLVVLLLCGLCALCACAETSEQTDQASQTEQAEGQEGSSEFTPVDSMELRYADQFSVDYDAQGNALITIGGTDRYFLPTENAANADAIVAALDDDVTILSRDAAPLYVAASSSMDFFRELGVLDEVGFTSTNESSWSLTPIIEAMEDGSLVYAGKYSAPDYELLLSEGVGLAIESTMIYHTPEVQEQLESLGIPVLVERSSYESHPLGRMEWIKLYGLLTGAEDKATAFFDEQLALLEPIMDEDQLTAQAAEGGSESTDESAERPEVAFFYFSSNGYANVRTPSDYISRLIAMAGGAYAFSNLEDDTNRSTVNLQMETFYNDARDADILIYNSTIEGELNSLDDLLAKNEQLASFKAVQEGNVWCIGRNMFQQTTGLGTLLHDLALVISGDVDESELTYLHRLS